MRNLRARPTLRLLETELNQDGRFSDIVSKLRDTPGASISLSDLDHPIIKKSVECFGDDPADDFSEGLIRSATQYSLHEVKITQWRGGVWKDETGVNWLICAGLAKGNHRDHDDFYSQVESYHATPESAEKLKPQEEDLAILKAENAARSWHRWKALIQNRTYAPLHQWSATEGILEESFDITIPDAMMPNVESTSHRLTTVQLWINQEGGIVEISVDFDTPGRWISSGIFHTAKLCVLNSIMPPMHQWDSITDASFYYAEDPKVFQSRIAELGQYISTGDIQPAVPDPHSHYTHVTDIISSTVDGHAIRALCGKYIVSSREPENLPTCPECEKLYASLNP